MTMELFLGLLVYIGCIMCKVDIGFLEAATKMCEAARGYIP